MARHYLCRTYSALRHENRRFCLYRRLSKAIYHAQLTIRDVENKVTSRWRLYKVATCAKYSGGSKFFTCQIMFSCSCKVSDHRSDFSYITSLWKHLCTPGSIIFMPIFILKALLKINVFINTLEILKYSQES